MKKRVLVCTFAFSVFALVGPLIWQTCPSAIKNGYKYLDKEVFAVIILTFPAILFSAGKPTPTLISLIEANIAFFAVVGALVGVFVGRLKSAVFMYVVMCMLLLGIEGYYVGFQFGDFQWLGYGAALLLYAVLFWVVFRYCHVASGAGTGRSATPTNS